MDCSRRKSRYRSPRVHPHIPLLEGCEKSGVELNVVLMDHEMPIMDGVTCVKLIRQMEVSGDLVAHVPIIAVTANARTEQVKILEVAGVVRVVS